MRPIFVVPGGFLQSIDIDRVGRWRQNTRIHFPQTRDCRYGE